ncbi:Transcriptional regulator, TetR family OS=Tsukamurella paurometabola (strain ATCC 8368 / DSM/ CCUG 35730 / CIP 100753 / JCM 10117 / KCTC 9821 / NBRC 16120/ NCIMB 702349 / NCTC 13040) OX=521096 GN=Tpau_0929 PE=4 SV=1 [Tsukamurella paurometabola]|nr:Bacterial regulatory proteins, tetR family [Tsukamurella paurometabola]
MLDAAIEVVGTRGLRGLTHRAVDGAAGVPSGTTSNHFRSRAALVRGILDRMVEQDLSFWEGFDGAGAPSVDEVTERLVGYVLWSVGAGRVRSTARLNLFAAAATSPDLQEPLRRARAAVEAAGAAIGANLGLDGPASALVMDATDAVVLRQLALASEDFDPRPTLGRLIAALRG